VTLATWCARLRTLPVPAAPPGQPAQPLPSFEGVCGT